MTPTVPEAVALGASVVLQATGMWWGGLHPAWGALPLAPTPREGLSFRRACCLSVLWFQLQTCCDLDLEQGWEPLKGCKLALPSCQQRWASPVDRGHFQVRGHRQRAAARPRGNQPSRIDGVSTTGLAA